MAEAEKRTKQSKSLLGLSKSTLQLHNGFRQSKMTGIERSLSKSHFVK